MNSYQSLEKQKRELLKKTVVLFENVFEINGYVCEIICEEFYSSKDTISITYIGKCDELNFEVFGKFESEVEEALIDKCS